MVFDANDAEMKETCLSSLSGQIIAWMCNWKHFFLSEDQQRKGPKIILTLEAREHAHMQHQFCLWQEHHRHQKDGSMDHIGFWNIPLNISWENWVTKSQTLRRDCRSILDSAVYWCSHWHGFEAQHEEKWVKMSEGLKGTKSELAQCYFTGAVENHHEDLWEWGGGNIDKVMDSRGHVLKSDSKL